MLPEHLKPIKIEKNEQTDLIGLTNICTAVWRNRIYPQYSLQLAGEDLQTEVTQGELLRLNAAVNTFRIETIRRLLATLSQSGKYGAILEVAAGLTPTSIYNTCIPLIQSDQPSVATERNRKLQRVSGYTNPILSLDVLTGQGIISILKQLLQVNHERKPIVIFGEGLLQYLSNEEIKQLFENLKLLCKVFPKSIFITPDTADIPTETLSDENIQGLKETYKLVSSKSQRNFKPRKPDEIIQIAESIGLRTTQKEVWIKSEDLPNEQFLRLNKLLGDSYSLEFLKHFYIIAFEYDFE